MNKRNFSILIAMFIVFILTGCSKPMPEPTLQLKYNDQQLKVLHYGDRYNKTPEDIERYLKDFMIGKKFEELPIIPFDEEIIIENANFEIDEYQVYDFILDDKANIISDFNAEGVSVKPEEDHKAYFKFTRTPEIIQYEEDAIHQKNIHCLLIKADINGDDFVFATLILDSKQ